MVLSPRVVRELRLNNGPELISMTLAEWAEAHGVTLEFIKPGKPMLVCSHGLESFVRHEL
jgi:hypothetical protein